MGMMMTMMMIYGPDKKFMHSSFSVRRTLYQFFFFGGGGGLGGLFFCFCCCYLFCFVLFLFIYLFYLPIYSFVCRRLCQRLKKHHSYFLSVFCYIYVNFWQFFGTLLCFTTLSSLMYIALEQTKQNLQNITLFWNSLLLSPIAGAFDDKMSRAAVVTFSKDVFAFIAHSQAI